MTNGPIKRSKSYRHIQPITKPVYKKTESGHYGKVKDVPASNQGSRGKHGGKGGENMK